MTQHKNKHRPKHQTHHANLNSKKDPVSATGKMTLIFAVAGLAAGALASQLDPMWTIGSSAFGAIGGYFIGHLIDKAAAKKK